jgi:hypothetical protein
LQCAARAGKLWGRRFFLAWGWDENGAGTVRGENMLLLRLACVGAVLALSASVALAEEFFGFISKIDGDKITVTKFEFGKKEKPKPKVLTVDKKLKVVTAKFNKEEKKVEAGEAIKDGLKNERFKDLGKGIGAWVVTNDDGKVTELRVFPPFKFKKKKKDDD